MSAFGNAPARNRVGSIIFFVVVATLAAADARAQSPVVVELFTSQGCGECPPAEAALAAVADRPGVIALAFHVDDWDYLGWRDVFARPANGRRQRGYAAARGARVVFTPQAIVNGSASAVGAQVADLRNHIARAARIAPAVEVALSTDRGWIAVEVDPRSDPAAQDEPAAPDAVATLFVVEGPRLVSVARGENAGRHLDQRHVVREWQTLGSWRGESATWRAPAPQDAGAVVVIVQEVGYGRVLGAARLDLGVSEPVVSVAGAGETRLP